MTDLLSLSISRFLIFVFPIFISLMVSIHILLTKQRYASMIGWMGVVWLSPYLGSVVYGLFGINRIRRRAVELRRVQPRVVAPLALNPFNLDPTYLNRFRPFYLMGQKIHPDPFTEGNSVRLLVSGDEAYPEMLGQIARATDSIAISTYIFNSDAIGKSFVDALAAAKNRGVRVYVLIDDVGSRYRLPWISFYLKRKGITFSAFLPPKRPRFFAFLNLRNHRKLCLIDGKAAFVGGMNICVDNCHSCLPKHPIWDVHFRVEGPVIDQLNRVFEEDWFFATRETIRLPDFCGLSGLGNAYLRAIPDGPDLDFEKLKWILIGAISNAQTRIRILTPYFLPDFELVSALKAAVYRGIKVEVVVPQKNNVPGFNFAMMALLPELVELGVYVYFSPLPFHHAKLAIVDDYWSFIGSSNWDSRSLSLNFELNVECVSSELAKELIAYFVTVKESSRPLTIIELDRMNWVQRLRNRLFYLASPYL